MFDVSESAFWMVWNPAGDSPTYRHDSEAGAIREASRLATANPGQVFFVLQAIRAVKKADVEHLILQEPIPF